MQPLKKKKKIGLTRVDTILTGHIDGVMVQDDRCLYLSNDNYQKWFFENHAKNVFLLKMHSKKCRL